MSGSGGRSAPCTRRRARLASCRAAVAVRPTIGAMSSNGTSNMSCSTKAIRSAGASACSTTSSASPTESAISASWMVTSGPAAGSGTCGPIGSSRRDLRERSMSRHTRATTVVSQPPRLPIPFASDRLSRIHASCTASSASLSEPSIR